MRKYSGQRGVALLGALFFSALVLGLVVSGTLMMESALEESDTGAPPDNLAREVAEIGLMHGLSWFRRQTTQPVLEFRPQGNENGGPPLLETEEPEIGLVREFELSPGYWGRCELRKVHKSILGVSAPEVADISKSRGVEGRGFVWRLISRGYVYRKFSETVSYDTPPNEIVAFDCVETEIGRLRVTLPAAAAIWVKRGDSCTIARGCTVVAHGAAGVAFPRQTGAPDLRGRLTASVPVSPQPLVANAVRSLFGVDRKQLRAMAHSIVMPNETLPEPSDEMRIIYVDASCDFGEDRPLRGAGILVITGNLRIRPGSGSEFRGLIHVEGDVVIDGPARIRGGLIVDGRCQLGEEGKGVEILYAPEVMRQLRTELGQYGFSAPVVRKVLPEMLKTSASR